MTNGLYNSLNPRPELLAGADDDLPVNVGPYIHDLGLDGAIFCSGSLSFDPR